jgi:enoyl-CoA hydratase
MVLKRERRGRVEILTLDRPEARNAVNPEVSQAIEAALDELEAERDVRVIVLTGNGPVFCAGADLKVVARGEAMNIETKRGGFGGLVRREVSKPIIAAVNGPALAGGFELVLACDLVVAGEDATFGLPEAKRGLLAAAGGPIRLAKRVPMALALEIVMIGDPIPARRAHAVGLVKHVVLTVRIVVARLGTAALIACDEHRDTLRKQQGGHEVAHLAATKLQHVGVR